MKKINKYLWGIIVGLVLAIVGYSGSNLVKTDYGRVAITEVQTISASGFRQAMNVYIPEGVTAKNPGPAVIVQHGGNMNKEEMKMYCTELSRRGYVVFAIDMYGMGKSQPLPDSQWLTAARGMYDAVKFARTLPYVDANRIGLLGYSRGGMAAQEALLLDNQGNNFIKNVFLIHSDPIVRDKNGFTDIYRNRNVFLLADLYDEFFFAEKSIGTGPYSNDANKVAQVLSSSADFINSPTAQAFLYSGDPTGKEKRGVGTYKKTYDNGTEGARTLVTYQGIHNSGWFSPWVVGQVVTFFAQAMPAGTTLASDDLVFPLDNYFSLVGIFGLLVFMISLTLFLVFNRPRFKDVFIAEPELRSPGGTAGLLWLWGLLLGITVLGVFVIKFLNMYLPAYQDSLFRSSYPLYHAMAAVLINAFALVACMIWYLAAGSRSGFDLPATGIFVGGKILRQSIAAGLIGILGMYAIVFAAKYLVNGEFLFWFWYFIPFGANRITGMLAVWLIFLAAHVAMSICANCFTYTRALGTVKWVNHILFGLIAALPTTLVVVYVYARFAATGWNPMFGGLGSAAAQVFTMPVFTFFAVLIARYIYDKTGNPYLGGIINGTVATVMEWTACEIRVPQTPVNPLAYAIIIGSILIMTICLAYWHKCAKAAEVKMGSAIQ